MAPDVPPLVLDVKDEAAMAALGEDIAAILRIGDRLGLVGDLGAGKTTLARAILRSLAGDPDLDVPSPTFTLVQTYGGRVPARHADLYRIAEPEEVRELGLGEPDAAELVEWPREPLPVMIAIAFSGETARSLTVRGPAGFLERLRRRRARREFLQGAGWDDAAATPLKQDASTRSYERLARGGQTAVLMDAPSFVPEPDSYPARARLAAGDNAAFLAVGAYLAARGLSTPAVLGADTHAGFLLLEDFGEETIARDGAPVPERYLATADVLARLHAAPPPLPLPGPPPHMPPRYDAELAAFEANLFLEWFMKRPADPRFEALWRDAIAAVWRGDDRLALRDVHSPNCYWLPRRQGIAKVGLIDYQDAMIAPSAFDVVSLAQDVRVPVPQDLEAAIVERYLAARPDIDTERWREAYHVIGAQRATRIAGAFVRLNDRDGKPQYLQHIPHVLASLARNLRATPVLAPLAGWFAAETPIVGES